MDRKELEQLERALWMHQNSGVDYYIKFKKRLTISLQKLSNPSIDAPA